MFCTPGFSSFLGVGALRACRMDAPFANLSDVGHLGDLIVFFRRSALHLRA